MDNHIRTITHDDQVIYCAVMLDSKTFDRVHHYFQTKYGDPTNFDDGGLEKVINWTTVSFLEFSDLAYIYFISKEDFVITQLMI